MDKLCKTAAGLDTFLKASFWGIAITIMVPVVVMPIAALTGGFEDSFLGLLAGYGITVERGEAGLPVSYRSILAVLSVLSAAISCIILYGIYLAREILRPMKEGRPFDTAVSRSFRRLGFVALAAGGAEFVVTAVMQHIVPNALADAAGAGVTVAVDSGYRYNISSLVAAALLFLFSYIFRYGEALQKQADETL